jgi:hypothetical protein
VLQEIVVEPGIPKVPGNPREVESHDGKREKEHSDAIHRGDENKPGDIGFKMR